MNEYRFEYLKNLADQDKLTDAQRKEYVALLKQKKVLDSQENL
jgi:hypothetical protein